MGLARPATIGASDPWLTCLGTVADAAATLVCLPYAGGSSIQFRTWPPALGPDVAVLAVELPGRGRRWRDAPQTQLRPLVASIAAALLGHVRRPLALYGHSMGALLAFELALELRRLGVRPSCLLLSGRAAPLAPLAAQPLHLLGDDEFVAAVARFGGLPRQVLEDAELRELVLPILRADFMLCETHRHAPEPPLDMPIVAFAGEDDELASPARMAGWRDETRGGFSLEILPGGHFFVAQHEPRLLAAITAALTRAAGAVAEPS